MTKFQLKYIKLCFFIFTIFLIFTFLRNIIIKKEYKLNELNTRLKDLQKENIVLRSNLEKLKSLETLDEIAKKYKFVKIDNTKVFKICEK